MQLKGLSFFSLIGGLYTSFKVNILFVCFSRIYMPAIATPVVHSTHRVLFSAYDAGWSREMPVKLITYPNGSQDLHRQTGSDFVGAVDRAKAMLLKQGFQVGEISFIGPTGAYMAVTPIAVAIQ